MVVCTFRPGAILPLQHTHVVFSLNFGQRSKFLQDSWRRRTITNSDCESIWILFLGKKTKFVFFYFKNINIVSARVVKNNLPLWSKHGFLKPVVLFVCSNTLLLYSGVTQKLNYFKN